MQLHLPGEGLGSYMQSEGGGTDFPGRFGFFSFFLFPSSPFFSTSKNYLSIP